MQCRFEDLHIWIGLISAYWTGHEHTAPAGGTQEDGACVRMTVTAFYTWIRQMGAALTNTLPNTAHKPHIPSHLHHPYHSSPPYLHPPHPCPHKICIEGL